MVSSDRGERRIRPRDDNNGAAWSWMVVELEISGIM